jgi:hypothetical protein
MEARFPGSKRTYTHLKDMDVCGADMNISHVRNATEHLEMWEQLIGTRKSPLKQAGMIGFGTLFQLLLRRLTLEDAVRRVTSRIGITGRAIVWEHAEPCMDVDKPHQLELLREDLARQQEESKPAPMRRSASTSKTKSTKRAAADRMTSKAKPAKR